MRGLTPSLTEGIMPSSRPFLTTSPEFARSHLPCSKDCVDGDSDSPSSQRNQTVLSASLFPNPLRLLVFVVVASFAMVLTSSIHSSLSSLASPSTQSFFTTGRLHNFTSGKGSCSGNQIPFGLAELVPQDSFHYAASVAISLTSSGISNLFLFVVAAVLVLTASSSLACKASNSPSCP